MSLAAQIMPRVENPVEVIEQIALRHDWAFERTDDHEILISVAGRWCDYQMGFTWLSDMDALHLGCGFDLAVPERRRAELTQLISRLNAQLWVGHFDHWTSTSTILYRHALLLAGNQLPSPDQCERAMTVAVEICERYYQAFQLVIWAGKSAQEALDLVLFETMGEA